MHYLFFGIVLMINMIEFEHVMKTYDSGIVALRDISVEIGAGECVSVIGPTGAGKTTFLKVISGEIKIDDGTLFFDGYDVRQLRRHEMARHRRRIGFIFQNFQLFPHKTVYENVAFMMEATGVAGGEVETDVPYALDLVELGHMAKRFPHELSAGEQQRLAIARSLVHQPDVILADEPTGNLDPSTTKEIVKIFKKIHRLGTTIIIATHDAAVVNGLKERVITLKDGMISSDVAKSGYTYKGKG